MGWLAEREKRLAAREEREAVYEEKVREEKRQRLAACYPHDYSKPVCRKWQEVDYVRYQILDHSKQGMMCSKCGDVRWS